MFSEAKLSGVLTKPSLLNYALLNFPISYGGKYI